MFLNDLSTVVDYFAVLEDDVKHVATSKDLNPTRGFNRLRWSSAKRLIIIVIKVCWYQNSSAEQGKRSGRK